MGDHGAQFPRGKGTVYDPALRIPLIIQWPGVTKSGVVRDELVSTLDLLPTWLAAAGVAAPKNLPGLELRPLLGDARDVPWRRYSFGFTTGAYPGNCFVQHSVRDDRYQLIVTARPGTDNLIARSYLDESHPVFVVSGATAADRVNLAPHVRQAWDRWLSPPQYELYDLKDDPAEWHDLADDPQHAEIKGRLLSALTSMREETGDPFLDPANVEAFVQNQLANRVVNDAKHKDFRWPYLETFPRWRAQHMASPNP
jgi:N-sulfoglucosamine sulfohydrolase